jgi:Fe-S oxidoreductase
MADTFTRFLHPEIGDAAIRVLEATGAKVTVVNPGCCGRALLSQGLVGAARKRLLGALDALAPHAEAGVPIVTLEPSCWSMIVDDAMTLTDDPRAARVAAACVSFERAVLDSRALALRPLDTRIVVRPHCHTRALGADGDTVRLMQQIPGGQVTQSDASCCGMAGAFGFHHATVSHSIFTGAPAGKESTDRLVLAGTSCRHQAAELMATQALHPAQMIEGQLYVV